MFYIVQPGDYLNLIAWRFGVSIEQILQFNPVAYYYPLYVGQRLFIQSPNFRAIVTYTVTGGDTLDSIARKFNTTKQSIMQLNNLSSEVVSSGQSLKIPTKL
ncbi:MULTISPECIES: LysM peptidoglycan-binding domain-containing protein [Clostridium]|uniref:LysM peptidoglycan-binding domain-containing protein n=1 Tax=Clostridium cibarium TaxID=2762247 RepID=A0ABR8PX70_9CLOT|nr:MULTISPECIES: LysM peptidoglycan-binding domain-containing protein [Clostridium]MBD7912776.1 LysM peptidoglycan-binding domain-containing protein [Clostridium cibarium]